MIKFPYHVPDIAYARAAPPTVQRNSPSVRDWSFFDEPTFIRSPPYVARYRDRLTERSKRDAVRKLRQRVVKGEIYVGNRGYRNFRSLYCLDGLGGLQGAVHGR